MLHCVIYLAATLLLLFVVPLSSIERDESSHVDSTSPPRRLMRHKKPPPALKVFAVVTDTAHPNFYMFNTSASKAGVHLNLLGVGDNKMHETPLSLAEKQDRKTKSLPFHSRSNFGRKILHLHEALRDIEDKSTLVILVDAYDSIFLSSTQRDLVLAFERARHYSHRLRVRYIESMESTSRGLSDGLGGDVPNSHETALIRRLGERPQIIASGEKNCWPDKLLSRLYPMYSLGHVMRYLNSGVIAGSVEAFLQLFDQFPYTGTEVSDQRYWVSAFLHSQNNTNIPVMDVDYQNHLVSSISKSSWEMMIIDEAVKSITIKDLMGMPVILHLPNNKDKLYDCYSRLVEKDLGYKPSV